MKRLLIVPIAAMFLLACGNGDDDNGMTGPDGSVTFPAVDQETLTMFCIRGQAVPPTSVSGSVTTDDCHSNIQNDGYFEGWRVRVGSERTVTFSADGQFDTFLELVRIDNLADPAGSAVLIASDDDSGPALQAELSATLRPNTEYTIFISGFNDAATGSYSLAMN